MPQHIQNFDNCTICVQPLEPKIAPKTISVLQPCGHKFHANPCFGTYTLHLVEPALQQNVDLATLIVCPNCKGPVKYIQEQISSQLISSVKEHIHKREKR